MTNTREERGFELAQLATTPWGLQQVRELYMSLSGELDVPLIGSFVRKELIPKILDIEFPTTSEEEQ